MSHSFGGDVHDIAIIGMSGRFPGADSIDKFWESVRNGEELISFLSDQELQAAGVAPETLARPYYIKAASKLDGIELFDADFFAMSARDASLTDPQHRILLECAWHALEDAGYDAQRVDGEIGMFAGERQDSYLINNLLQSDEGRRSIQSNRLWIANDKDYLPLRISFSLGLTGPSAAIQSACSTSLMTVHTACQHLWLGECSMAMAGAVSIRVPNVEGYRHMPSGVRSADGHTRPFDADATGTIFGSAAAVIVLKPLKRAVADGDSIYAVIKGSATCNNGATGGGITTPSVKGQSRVIGKAMKCAGVHPETIGLVEAHGTGTRKGDPVEIAALTDAYRSHTSKKQYCAIGSVKSNTGHLHVAAGMAGLIKAALSVRDGVLPPTINFNRPNPALNLPDSPFFVNTELQPWENGAQPRRAAVSAFGFGGTNAHVILEQPPQREPSAPSRPASLLVLSAKTPAALDEATGNIAQHLRANPDENLDDIAYTLQTGRRQFDCRRTVVANSPSDAVHVIERNDRERMTTGDAKTDERPVVFMFPGHGAQYVNMARGLYDTDSGFRRDVDRCAELLLPHLGSDLRVVLFPKSDMATAATRIEDTLHGQTALFTISYATARLWMRWGVTPESMVGYSVGEYVAATLAGVLTLPDALELLMVRSRLIDASPPGAMLAIAMAPDEIESLAGEGVYTCAICGPKHTLVGGLHKPIEALAARLTADGVACQELRVNRASHTELLKPAADKMRAAVERFERQPPRVSYVSTATGRWATDSDVADSELWVAELWQPLKFSQAVEQLAARPDRLLLEAGPGNSLGRLAGSHPSISADQPIISSIRDANNDVGDWQHLLSAAAALWRAGVELDWDALHAGTRRRRLHLPTYPFQRKRYWIEPANSKPEFQKPTQSAAPRKLALVDEAAILAGPAVDSSPIPPTESPACAISQSPKSCAASDSPSTGQAGSVPDAIQHDVIEMWRDLLGAEWIDGDGNFFDLGGNSLIAVQLVSRVRDSYHIELPLAALLDNPTVQGFAAAIVDEQLRSSDGETIDRLLDEVENESPGDAASSVCETEPASVSDAAAPAVEFCGETSVVPYAAERAEDVRSAPPLDFSLFFFSADAAANADGKYDFLIEAAKFADRHDFSAIWTPERHFHRFGGIYPNPSVLAAALATVTDQVQLRAGSVIAPVHHPIRIAEEWSVVDNLSGGRVGIAFAPGFHTNDFVFAPNRFDDRRDITAQSMQTVQRLWRGESVTQRDGAGRDIEVRLFPKPIQNELPVWMVTTRNVDAFIEAGRLGANVLTALLNQSVDELAVCIAEYRKSLAAHGHDAESGQVTLMLHAFIGTDLDEVRETVREPFCNYLRTHVDFAKQTPRYREVALHDGTLTAADTDALLEHAFQRYFNSASLIGTHETCLEMAARLRAIGVNEIGCLIDFGVDDGRVMESLHHLHQLSEAVAARSTGAGPSRWAKPA